MCSFLLQKDVWSIHLFFSEQHTYVLMIKVNLCFCMFHWGQIPTWATQIKTESVNIQDKENNKYSETETKQVSS
jgi:hypothetical protein